MKATIFILSLALLSMSCINKPKKRVSKESNNSVMDSISKEKDGDTIVKLNEEKHINLPKKIKEQKILDYSLKAKNVKTKQDSAVYLKHYYKQFSITKDSLSEILFFRMLPNTFEKFNNLYGFSEVSGGMPLYGEMHTLEYDNIRKNVADSIYYLKLINTGIKGSWDADNVTMLQEVLNNNFLNNPTLFSKVLLTKNRLEVESFWVFFFDGPHPENRQELYESVLSKFVNVDDSMIPVVKSAYDKVKEDWKEH